MTINTITNVIHLRRRMPRKKVAFAVRRRASVPVRCFLHTFCNLESLLSAVTVVIMQLAHVYAYICIPYYMYVDVMTATMGMH